MELIIYTDGASRGNPGHASYGFTILDSKGRLVFEEGKHIGVHTNNVAEYTAVLNVLEYVEQNMHEVNSITLFADSRLIVEQLSGNFKVKNKVLRKIYEKIKEIENRIGNITYKHIYREKNKKADALANQALDKLLK